VLYNGEALEVMDKLIAKGITVDAIITDPPYGTTACKWDSVIPFDAMWLRLNKLIKPNGAVVLFGSEPFSSALRMSNIKNYKYDWKWEKTKATGHLNAKRQPLRNIEDILVFYSNQCRYNPQGTIEVNKKQVKKDTNCTMGNGYGNYGKQNKTTIQKIGNYPKQVLKFKKPNKNVHPTQKPVALMEYLIKTYTNENELVLDFTMGSGSTGVACKNTNRKFIGIEMDKGYFDIAKDRIEGIL
jgi:DNA modification methylase